MALQVFKDAVKCFIYNKSLLKIDAIQVLFGELQPDA